MTTEEYDGPEREQVEAMFDRIARRYDLLNRLLSLGRDVAWRKALVRAVPEGRPVRVLDLATGTGDVLRAVMRARGGMGAGVDVSQGMLMYARGKLPQAGLVRGDATRLALADASFGAVTIAFGIRNVSDVDAALREMHRVLAPDGRALILEFSLPANRLFRALYLTYFRHVLPRLGAWISGDAEAYRYLNQSVEGFPHGRAFCALMERAGFVDVRAHPLTFGIATLYEGRKA